MGLNRALASVLDFISHDTGETRLLWLRIYLHLGRLFMRFFRGQVHTEISLAMKWKRCLKRRSSLMFLLFRAEISFSSVGYLKSIRPNMCRLQFKR